MSKKKEDIKAQEREMRQREMELRTQINPKAQKHVDEIAQEKTRNKRSK